MQVIWKNNQKVISLLQFDFPSNSNSQLKILANSVSKQLAEVAQNQKIKFQLFIYGDEQLSRKTQLPFIFNCILQGKNFSNRSFTKFGHNTTY